MFKLCGIYIAAVYFTCRIQMEEREKEVPHEQQVKTFFRVYTNSEHKLELCFFTVSKKVQLAKRSDFLTSREGV
ncbi:hypothetical protein K1719_042023 [Acacia pycnantha]|nr:hypothetical protein K1719_042023 [Acacia pycnantha]